MDMCRGCRSMRESAGKMMEITYNRKIETQIIGGRGEQEEGKGTYLQWTMNIEIREMEEWSKRERESQNEEEKLKKDRRWFRTGEKKEEGKAE